LGELDVEGVRSLIGRDRVVNCVLDSRLDRAPDLSPRGLGGLLWGLDDGVGAELRAAAFSGGNLIPVGDDLAALQLIADQLSRTVRACSSIVGPAAAVQAMWPLLSRRWGPARAIRRSQPFLVTRHLPDIAIDPCVRAVRPAELPSLLPASVAMFTEELGVSPLGRDAGRSYRARVSDLIASGRSFARFDDQGHVEFKAEIGALAPGTAQIQGVWVRPDLRGRGVGTAAMATVLRHALRLAPSVSLYVNDFNLPARRMYARLGMQQTNTLSTILF
jgi:predicted GNAT family acetyltransferase